MKGRYGETLVIDVLRGSKNKRILDLGLDSLSTYGISKKSVHALKAMINHLIHSGYLRKSDGEYPVLLLTDCSKDVLSGKESIMMKMPKETVRSTAKDKIKTGSAAQEINKDLFDRLRNLRARLASKQGVPAFVIFPDRALADMCAQMPRTLSEFACVYGVGERKLKAYGEIFLKEINSKEILDILD